MSGRCGDIYGSCGRAFGGVACVVFFEEERALYICTSVLRTMAALSIVVGGEVEARSIWLGIVGEASYCCCEQSFGQDDTNWTAR